ncbi:MBL fold metallo-hydrolase RNA specificity domain-containing protein [Mycoplasmopsis felifaucium]|uniref:MBL fold metallo-hydrolase RNA specificity domain-containing protein n=1 Tax=Mycoplasmopsis felifaucium TaxID=35768 RepID=UPI000488BE26|nr:ribonuclease J [Mycoplasmopsis felifaucium]
MNNVNIFALGGLDENGKNCYVFEYNERIYIINSGTKIPINSTNGIDTLIPNFDYLVKHKDKIEGIFITDVKNESFSSLPWLVMKLPGVPIYTSKFNKILIIDRLSKYKINDNNIKINILDQTTKIGPVFVESIELAGSMPGHIGLDFITPDGDYVFMFNFVEGNLGIYGNIDFANLAKSKFAKRKIKALIVDSGRANYNGRAIDKIMLPKQVEFAFMAAKEDERIIVGAYDEEMFAINQILEFARQTKRPVITYGKTYGQVLEIIKKAKPDLPLPEVIDYKYANKTKNAVILVTGTTERLYSRFLRITDNKDVYLKLQPSDTIIMIAPAINGLESVEAVTLDEIARITPRITEVTNSEFYRHRPAREDLVKLVNILKPEYIIPAQGLYRYLLDASKYIQSECLVNPKNIFVLQNGQVVHIMNGKIISYKGKVKEVGDVIIDGFGVGDISTEVINEREVLGREGVILVTSRYNPKTKLLVGKMQVNYVGSIDKDEKKEATELIKTTITNLIDTKKFEGIKDLQNQCRSSIRKKIFKSYNKEPIVVVSFIQI